MNKLRKIQYDIVYMKMALAISTLSYAIRNKVGCVILSKEGQLISQGYNGTPSGMNNECENVECICNNCIKFGRKIKDIKNLNNCKDCEYSKLITKDEVLHAESNAISKCAKWISSTDGATIYVTLSPCLNCAKLIVQAGIKRVVYLEEYHNIDGIKLLNKSGVKVEQIPNLDELKLIEINYGDE